MALGSDPSPSVDAQTIVTIIIAVVAGILALLLAMFLLRRKRSRDRMRRSSRGETVAEPGQPIDFRSPYFFQQHVAPRGRRWFGSNANGVGESSTEVDTLANMSARSNRSLVQMEMQHGGVPHRLDDEWARGVSSERRMDEGAEC